MEPSLRAVSIRPRSFSLAVANSVNALAFSAASEASCSTLFILLIPVFCAEVIASAVVAASISFSAVLFAASISLLYWVFVAGSSKSSEIAEIASFAILAAASTACFAVLR